MLVADDQIIPESCVSRLQAAADIASTWALNTGQQYHVATPDKTAVLLLGYDAPLVEYNSRPVFLSGVPVPGTLLKKWVGILWDGALTFEPFLVDRIKAARASFIPLCALAREGLAPLSEIRNAMGAKVENALFYGAMFLFLVPAAGHKLTQLQLDFERALMGAPPWLSDTLMRAAGGWQLTWGDRLVYDALAFRAELFCCESGLLVRSVWQAAQQFPGHTFAEVSRQRLADLGLPEIFHFPGWAGFLSDGSSCLKEYKSMLKESLVRSSVQTWKTSFLHSSAVQPFLMSQQFPCSAGGRLLEAGALDKLHDADLWEAFRFGLGASSEIRKSPCILCGSGQAGHAHILATCPVTHEARLLFLSIVDSGFAARLGTAPQGDWPSALLSPHLDLYRLKAAVTYCAQIMSVLAISKEHHNHA